MVDFILIDWGEHIESVPAELGSNPAADEIKNTRIRVKDPRVRLTINTTSTRTKNPDGSQQIVIQYSQENNQDLVNDQAIVDQLGAPNTWYWGTATIDFSADRNSCSAVWEDRNYPKYNGEAQRCIVLPRAPLKLEQRDRKIVSQLERRQAAFREGLLSMYDCCAITDESTEDALEAAHIVPVAEGGRDSPDNGILLRADIHRVYDKCLFQIQHDGSITISDRNWISEYYRNILQGKTISNEIIERIQEALAKRARLRLGCRCTA